MRHEVEELAGHPRVLGLERLEPGGSVEVVCRVRVDGLEARTGPLAISR